MENREPIDFVLPWVDGEDASWRQRRDRYAQALAQRRDNDHGAVRYRDTNTLRYALRAIHAHCPWYGKIHLITEGHLPPWLDASHPKIRIVTHEELYFNRSHLPTFNSSSIEMNLPNLRGVSERFVYLNDDFLILAPLEEERFFRDGLPVDFLLHGWIPRNRLYRALRDDSAWVHALNNNLELINRVAPPAGIRRKETLYHSSYPASGKLANFLLDRLWRRYYFIRHWHHPQPYLFSALREAYELFKEPMMRCSANRFRSENDLTQYLYRYYHLATERFMPRYYGDGYHADIRSLEDLPAVFDALQSGRYRFAAIYDNYPAEESERVVGALTAFLERFYPRKAPFEK